MNDLVIIGVDPGKRAGMARFEQVSHSFKSWCDDAHDACHYVDDMTQRWSHNTHDQAQLVIACERYAILPTRGPRSPQYDAIEMIGVIRYMCRERGITLLLNGPSDAARVGGPTVIRQLDWHYVGEDHPDKATAQLLLAIATLRPSVYSDLLSLGMVEP